MGEQLREIGVGILGFGTVGAGVADGLLRHGEAMSRRLGVKIILRRIADLDIVKDRGIQIAKELLTTDAEQVIGDERVDIVVETIGGVGIAKQLILKALNSGKCVVTANKKLLAEYGGEIFEAASKNGVDIYFGASVGGGIPIIRCLREGLAGNEIVSMLGILNGTCNYILTRMINEGANFSEVLKDAQHLGFAEQDPTLDIDGWDTAHKACILSSLAYGISVSPKDIEVHGIRELSKVDVVYAGRLGYMIKLLAHIARKGDNIEVGVHPTLVPKEQALSAVNGVFNAVMVHGDLSDDLLFYGKGAGRAPTASTVIGDIGDIARNLVTGRGARWTSAMPKADDGEVRLAKPGEIEAMFYIRLMVVDHCGALGQLCTIFGQHGVSIKLATSHEFVKGEEREGVIPVVMRTHIAKTENVKSALRAIEEAGIIGEKPVLMRMI